MGARIPIDWSGTDFSRPVATIAQEKRCSPEAVRQARVRLGIPKTHDGRMVLDVGAETIRFALMRVGVLLKRREATSAQEACRVAAMELGVAAGDVETAWERKRGGR